MHHATMQLTCTVLLNFLRFNFGPSFSTQGEHGRILQNYHLFLQIQANLARSVQKTNKSKLEIKWIIFIALIIQKRRNLEDKFI